MGVGVSEGGYEGAFRFMYIHAFLNGGFDPLIGEE